MKKSFEEQFTPQEDDPSNVEEEYISASLENEEEKTLDEAISSEKESATNAQEVEQAESEVEKAFNNESGENSHADNELDEMIESVVEASNKGELSMNALIDALSQLDPEIRDRMAEGIKEMSSEDINNDIKELQEKLDKLNAIVRGGGKLNEKEGKAKQEIEAEIAVWLVKLAIKVFVEIIKSLPKPSSGQTNV